MLVERAFFLSRSLQRSSVMKWHLSLRQSLVDTIADLKAQVMSIEFTEDLFHQGAKEKKAALQDQRSLHSVTPTLSAITAM